MTYELTDQIIVFLVEYLLYKNQVKGIGYPELEKGREEDRGNNRIGLIPIIPMWGTFCGTA